MDNTILEEESPEKGLSAVTHVQLRRPDSLQPPGPYRDMSPFPSGGWFPCHPSQSPELDAPPAVTQPSTKPRSPRCCPFLPNHPCLPAPCTFPSLLSLKGIRFLEAIYLWAAQRLPWAVPGRWRPCSPKMFCFSPGTWQTLPGWEREPSLLPSKPSHWRREKKISKQRFPPLWRAGPAESRAGTLLLWGRSPSTIVMSFCRSRMKP